MELGIRQFGVAPCCVGEKKGGHESLFWFFFSSQALMYLCRKLTEVCMYASDEGFSNTAAVACCCRQGFERLLFTRSGYSLFALRQSLDIHYVLTAVGACVDLACVDSAGMRG